MKPIKAVIFDMDGVLIDSEPVYLHHQYTHLKPSYPWITLESMYPLVGISGQEYMPFMAKLCRRTDDAAFRQEMDAMNAGCRVYYPDILRKEVRPLLHELKQMGLQVALASSSSRECIEQVLTQCEIRELFDCIVSGHEFTRSKPDPEIYRFTMDKLGRKPEECLIVEDSTYGVQAGTAAGGVVAALRDERFPFDQRAAQLHIDSLAELPALAACGGKRIRAAFFDVDGTLITVGGHRMPPSVAPALQALQRSGVQVFLCTGRHALEIEEENMLPGITVDGAVYMNGQLCELQGQIVRETPIPAGDLSALKQFLQKKNRSCIFLEKDRMYANCVDARMEVEQAKIGTAVPAVRDISDLENRRIYQVIPFVNEEEEEELLRQMPHSLEGEQAVLGSMLIDEGCVKDVMEQLRPDDFYLKQNREIFETIYSMFLYSKPIDGVTVAGEMERAGLSTDDTRSYLVQLMEVTPTSANVMEYVRIVREKALLRAVAAAAFSASSP